MFGGNKIGIYIPLTEEEKILANHVDLVDFLHAHGEELVRCGHEWRWKRHDSVTIDQNRWCQHSVSYGNKKLGGGPVKFLQEFSLELYGRQMTYPEAVLALAGRSGEATFRQSEPKIQRDKRKFVAPERSGNMRRVYAYLIKQRCIDAEVITHFAKSGALYEDAKYHNIVFAGLDENDIMRHAHKKSTCTQGESYRGNVEGSDARYGFCHIGTSGKIYSFESPIDMLSFITIHKENWREHSYLSFSGISPQALLHSVTIYPHLSEAVLCLDNDSAGIAAMNRISEQLGQLGYSDVSQLLSISKDWNEDLVVQNQQTNLGVHLENESQGYSMSM